MDQETASDTHGPSQYFVFRCGPTWFSVPATTVGEVTIASPIVPVPHCNPVLEGLCRQQSEFIPVLSLANLLQLDNGAATAVGTQLITLAGMHPWATRISEAIGIETIESIDSSNHDRQTLAGGSMPIRDAVLGTSVFRDHVARILNPNQIYELALHALEHDWRQHGINRQSSRQMVDVR